MMERKGAKRARIEALDGIRGLLAVHIVFGHFLRFSGPSQFWLQFFSQVNVTVGAFFALSGYVTAYTCTQVGENETSLSFRTSSWKKWWISKAMTFYPMHWFVLLVFGPIFVYSDILAAPSLTKGLATAIANGLLSVTLTQAWFPVDRAEIWNAPTWFLSSLTFCNLTFAIGLPRIAQMNKSRLRISLLWLFGINLMPVIVYFFVAGNKTWEIMEGMTKPKDHPSLGLFNIVRFLPIFNVSETLMGAVACRLVMLDSKEKRQSVSSRTVIIPFGITIGILLGRALEWLPSCSDLWIRKFVVVPMFLNFVMATHRTAILSMESNAAKDPVSELLCTKCMVWLGNLSFPIYILHGPIGQLFYKRSIATMLWGGVLKGQGFFCLYLTTVLLSAMIVQKLFSCRKTISLICFAREEIQKCI